MLAPAPDLAGELYGALAVEIPVDRTRSGPLTPFIAWKVTADENVEVTNDTADLYRYFGYTDEAEFLDACVVEHNLEKSII